MADKPPSKAVRKEIQVHWSRGERLDPVMVDHMLLQMLNDNFYLTFGQLRPPEEPLTESVAEIRPVVRIVLTKSAARAIADTLDRNVPKEKESE